jgi:hypothetical protein
MTVTTSWQRFTFTFTQNTTKSTGIYRNTGDDATDILMWGGQIEARATATAYTVTTTQPITNYIPVLLSAGGNQARFDHTPTTGESLGVLIEEQRKNLALQSADFSTTWSSANQVSITSNTIVAPDGTLTGDKLIADATSNVHFVVQNTGSISAPWTFSCYAKAGEYSRVGFSYSNTGYVFFNLTTGVQEGTVGGGITSTSITSVGNGWYRISFTSTSTASGGNIGIYLFNTTYTSGIPTFTGNGFSGAYIWGAQLEAGSFSTSYIATTSASATRTADAASMTGTNFSSWYNQAQGTIYADATTYMDVTNTANRTDTVTISEGTASTNSMLFGVNTVGSANVMYLYTLANGSPQVDLQLALTSGSYKTSYAYKVNDFALCLNGSSASTDGSGILSYSVNQMWIGSRFNSGQHQNGTIKKIAYYPIRVTNAQLQALTT